MRLHHVSLAAHAERPQTRRCCRVFGGQGIGRRGGARKFVCELYAAQRGVMVVTEIEPANARLPRSPCQALEIPILDLTGSRPSSNFRVG
jgi:hypothetical protein